MSCTFPGEKAFSDVQPTLHTLYQMAFTYKCTLIINSSFVERNVTYAHVLIQKAPTRTYPATICYNNVIANLNYNKKGDVSAPLNAIDASLSKKMT
jgi:hypothetical protein